jgi:hypothetical protein
MIKKVILSILKGLNRRANKPNWRNMRQLEPLSDIFGYDRGDQSVHRYYIDDFIASHTQSVKGIVLEVGDNQYTARHSVNVTESHIIHYTDATQKNSFVGDLTRNETLPASKFDCFVCTQTFNFIYDFHAAIRGAHYLLKPGGTLLATVSGIQQISKYDASRWGDYWRFTIESVIKAFGDVFGHENIQVISYGNVLSCVAAMQGLASVELTKEELNYKDPGYQLVIGVVARKI